jgi:hypothetical protein
MRLGISKYRLHCLQSARQHSLGYAKLVMEATVLSNDFPVDRNEPELCNEESVAVGAASPSIDDRPGMTSRSVFALDSCDSCWTAFGQTCSRGSVNFEPRLATEGLQ